MDGSAQQMQMCPLQWIPALPHKLRKRYCRQSFIWSRLQWFWSLCFSRRSVLICWPKVMEESCFSAQFLSRQLTWVPAIYSPICQTKFTVKIHRSTCRSMHWKSVYTPYSFLSPTFAIPAPISGSSGILHPATGLAELEWASTFSSNWYRLPSYWSCFSGCVRKKSGSSPRTAHHFILMMTITGEKAGTTIQMTNGILYRTVWTAWIIL